MDFRVEAVIGYTELYYADKWFPVGSTFIVEATSGWSAVQTITLSGETTSSSPPSQAATFPPVASNDDSQPYSSDQTYASGQTYTPDKTYTPDFIFANPLFTLVVVALFGVVVVAVVLMVFRRRVKTSMYSNVSFYQASGGMGLYV